MVKSKKVHFHGWRSDQPDQRDFMLADARFQPPHTVPLPPSVDLRDSGHMPPIADQGNLGSCTAFATCAAFDFLESQQGRKFLNPSHLFEYWNSRVLEGSTGFDSGATIRDAIKATVQFGMCPETRWPYKVSKFATKPPAKCFASAKRNEIIGYFRIDNTNLTELLQCLAQGFPIVFGATLYESFENPGPNSLGIIPMPKKNEKVLGGHAQLIVGYSSGLQTFLVRNSWGKSWGLGGYESMPYAYLTNTRLASDFWTLRKVA